MNPLLIIYLVIMTAGFAFPVLYSILRNIYAKEVLMTAKIIVTVLAIVFLPVVLLLAGYGIWEGITHSEKKEQPE